MASILATLMTPPNEAAAVLTFGDTINISENPGSSNSPQLAISENGNVYVAWIDDSDGPVDTFFSYLSSGDDGFGTPINLSNTSASSFGVGISVSAENVYVVWSEDGEIFLAHGQQDGDGSVSFGSPQNLSNSTGNSESPAIASFDGAVYVAWEESKVGSSKPDIHFIAGQQAGKNFGMPVNLSNNTGFSSNARIAIASTNVYVAWDDDTANPGNEQDIIVRGSVDGGLSFGTEATFNTPGGFLVLSNILPVGADSLYLLGDDSINADVFFVTGTIDSGGDFALENPENISSNEGFSSQSEFVVSNDGNIHVVWIDDSNGLNDVFASSKTNASANFSGVVSLTLGSEIPSAPRITLSSTGDLYVTWVDFAVGGGDVILTARLNGNSDFEGPQNLSNNDGASLTPILAASGQDLVLAWADKSAGSGDILFRDITSGGDTSTIIIENTSPRSPKWGKNTAVSGTTNGAETDSVTVEWGDGSSTINIEISGSSWGPVEHSYNKSDTGTMQIIARLIDSGGAELVASDPEEITVERHDTFLSLNNIHSVEAGGDVVVIGVLSDLDLGIPLASGEISFSGTGSNELPNAVTGSDGLYISQGPSPGSVDTLWTVEANYAGDISYAPSTSVIRTFDTSPVNATEFAVPVGAPSQVNLVGFAASVEFDEVTSVGTILVSSCPTPDNSRYLSMDLCLILSTSVDTAPDSFAHITFSFQNKTVPDGHTTEEIDVFRETLDGFVDITEARDLQQQTVTGVTKDFSTFVMGVAVHEPPAEEAMRQQLFVGRNELAFNDISSKSIRFDDQNYSLGSLVTVSVSDDAANADGSVIDILIASIRSSSDTIGIQLNLGETGNDTGEFIGSFTVVESDSSSDKGKLKVREGDTITGSYLAAASAPFRLTIDDVEEAGLIEIIKFVVDVDPPEINTPELTPIGDAYYARLIGSELGSEARIELLMSYSNVNPAGLDEPSIRLMQSETEPQDITRPEWIDISPPPLQGSRQSAGLDIDKKTIIGNTDFVSNFTIAIPRDPGGGGGGLPRPGTGIILDTVADIASENRGSGGGSGGGGGGSRSTGIAQTHPGNDVETTLSAPSGPVTIRFETVQGDSGQLKVESKELSAFEDKFEEITVLEDNDEHGIVSLGGTTYSSTGDVFDIDASAIDFEGMIDVTIPYDENAVTAISGFESDVRFLHYDEEKGVWEDNTVSSDALANTVTGRLDSLSPVLAAVIIHQDMESINQLVISNPSFVISDMTSEATLTMNMNNKRQTIQNYVIVAQVLDQKSVVQHIEWQKRSIAGAKEENVSMSWVQMEEGPYVVKVFIWTEMENPSMLAPVILPRMDP